jgi:hypothetical protein
MTDIAYLVMSDLHFGAANSVLSSLQPGDPDRIRYVDPTTASPVATSLVDCLRSLSATNRNGPPTLIFAGDVLDLALSADDIAAAVFSLFVKDAFDPARPAVRPEQVIYLPGNHDHHLWEAARETQYVRYVSRLSADDSLEPAWHGTKMLPAPDDEVVSSPLMAALLRRATGSDTKVAVAYPNLALHSDATGKTIAVHHGHFTEAIYTLMSKLKDLMFPEQRHTGAVDSWEWEAENFAWIDFMWGTLGRSGDVGEDVGVVYAELESRACVDHYIHNVVEGLVAKQHLPGLLHVLKHPETKALTMLIDWVAAHRSGSERSSPAAPLTEAGWAGLRSYLEGPLARQVKGELHTETIPEDFSFVFGHTHKPFLDRREYAGYPRPILLANTGGWVVDRSTTYPSHGGSAVLISDELDMAAIRMFAQTEDHQPSAITVQGDSPWADELRQRLDLSAEPWASLAAHAARAVTERHQLAAAYEHQY